MTEGTASIGHNSVGSEQLRSIVSRVERLEEEKKAISDDIKEVYSEAKTNGFDAPALRAVVRYRREEKETREARQALIETYLHALGDLGDTPLGAAAAEKAADTPKQKRKRRSVQDKIDQQRAERGEAGPAPTPTPTPPGAVASSFAADAEAAASAEWPDDQQVANAEREAADYPMGYDTTAERDMDREPA